MITKTEEKESKLGTNQTSLKNFVIKLKSNLQNNKINHFETVDYSLTSIRNDDSKGKSKIFIIERPNLIVGLKLTGSYQENSFINYSPNKTKTSSLILNKSEHLILIGFSDSALENILITKNIFFEELQIAIENIKNYQINFSNSFVSIIDYSVTSILECSKAGIIQHFLISSKVQEILFYLFEALDLSLISEKKSLAIKTENEKLDEAKVILISNIKSPPIIPHLARAIGLNEFKLKQRFKAVYGQTIFEFLTKHRMKMAKEFLIYSDKNISEIAETVGYGYAHHFSSAFKKYYGILPQQFRRENKKNNDL